MGGRPAYALAAGFATAAPARAGDGEDATAGDAAAESARLAGGGASGGLEGAVVGAGAGPLLDPRMSQLNPTPATVTAPIPSTAVLRRTVRVRYVGTWVTGCGRARASGG